MSQSFSDRFQKGRWFGFSGALSGLFLCLAATPAPAAAETYDECVKRHCEANDGYVFCGNVCGLRSYPSAPSAPRAPLLYGAIAVDGRTLITGFGKDFGSRAEANRRALAMCRRAGGSHGGCRIVVSRNNSCLALSTSRGSMAAQNTWGYALSLIHISEPTRH